MKQRTRSQEEKASISSRRQTESSTYRSLRSEACSFGLWWLGLWLLFLSSTPYVLVERWRVTDLPENSLFAQEGYLGVSIWDPRLAVAAEAMGFGESPFIFGSFIAAVCLAIGAVKSTKSKSQGLPWFLVLLVSVGLSCVEPRSTLATIVCVGFVGYLAQRANTCATTRLCYRDLALGLALLVFSVMSTLEFGFIAIALTLLVVQPLIKQLQSITKRWRASSILAGGWLGLLLLPSLFSSGYSGALLRPISWMWLAPPIELLPSMTPVWLATDFGWFHGLAMILLLDCWRRILQGRASMGQALFWTLLTVIGIGCARYFWLAMATLLITVHSSQRSTSLLQASSNEARLGGPDGNLVRLISQPKNLAWRPGMVVTMVGLLAMGFQLATSGSMILASDVIVRTISPSQWNVSGVVMLHNLEQVTAWQGPSMRSTDGRDQYRPVLTDRWDVFHAQYTDYLAVYKDWTNWKREAYLRSDGSWGGYQAVFSDWEPVFVVADSGDMEGIHTVSLDSQWKAIGVDSHKVVFARTGAEVTQPYVQYASRGFSTLEFPRPSSDIDFERVVALGALPKEALRVSAVLTSLRLPYAGLRVLPSDRASQHSPSSMFALAELANRTHRYSGVFSILDNVRALSPVNFQRNSDPAVTEAALRYTANLKRKLEDIGVVEGMQPVPQVRVLLQRGLLNQAQEQLAEMERSTEAEFFRVLLSAANESAATTLSKLQQLPLTEMPEKLASEYHFYLGCLANELGNVGLAQSAFADSLKLESGSPFAAVASFYLSQIGELEFAP
jgi:hypothetical protein